MFGELSQNALEHHNWDIAGLDRKLVVRGCAGAARGTGKPILVNFIQ
jgi:hypothetical protein